MWWHDKPYVSAAQRRAETERTKKKLTKSGRSLTPVTATGRKIAITFWGDSWCKHLESYSDFGNRLPRGRSYLRNGSVIDLQIRPGAITALVSGSELYEIEIDLKPLNKSLWSEIKSRCSGQIGSLVDLLQGKLSSDVMSVVTDRAAGLFPQPKEIRMNCSCPDYAGLCKHLAAVLYGVGVQFDKRPELFFQLRNVDHLELVAAAGASMRSPKTKAANVLAEDSLADIFGIELAGFAAEPPQQSPPPPRPRAAKERPATRNKRPDPAVGKKVSRVPAKLAKKQGEKSVAKRSPKALAVNAGSTKARSARAEPKAAGRIKPVKTASVRKRVVTPAEAPA